MSELVAAANSGEKLATLLQIFYCFWLGFFDQFLIWIFFFLQTIEMNLVFLSWKISYRIIFGFLLICIFKMPAGAMIFRIATFWWLFHSGHWGGDDVAITVRAPVRNARGTSTSTAPGRATRKRRPVTALSHDRITQHEISNAAQLIRHLTRLEKKNPDDSHKIHRVCYAALFLNDPKLAMEYVTFERFRGEQLERSRLTQNPTRDWRSDSEKATHFHTHRHRGP